MYNINIYEGEEEFNRQIDCHRCVAYSIGKVYYNAGIDTELEEYLDYYNNRRIKLKLNGLTPVQHRSQAIVAA